MNTFIDEIEYLIKSIDYVSAILSNESLLIRISLLNQI